MNILQPKDGYDEAAEAEADRLREWGCPQGTPPKPKP